VFGGIEGTLAMLRVDCCTRCSRKGRYSVRKANMMKWKQQLNSDCPKRDAPQLQERCNLLCPDLPKVL
jgi:hypothetical protein